MAIRRLEILVDDDAHAAVVNHQPFGRDYVDRLLGVLRAGLDTATWDAAKITLADVK